MAPVKIGLGLKLAVCLVGSLFLIFGVISVYDYHYHREHLQETVINSAMRIADTVNFSLQYNMINHQCAEAFELINTIGTLRGIERIRIFNKNGEIEYSTSLAEIATFVDKNAEACYACHKGDVPTSDLTSDQRWRIFTGADGNRVLGLINPIRNEERCSSADCHYHPADLQVLGVLDVNMSLKDIDTHLVQDQWHKLTAYLLTMLAVAVISVIFIVFMVHRPVARLMEGTREIARGNLDRPIHIESHDELGLLAESFNAMVADLKIARDESHGWAKTLEQRVAQKSAELERAHAQMIGVEKMASLGKLSAIVAHEINNPLTGVLTYAKLLHKKVNSLGDNGAGFKPEEFEKYLAIIENETARCGDIVKNLLMFSKKSTVRFEPNNFNELLEKSVKLVNHQVELASIELEKDLATNLPAVVCDAGQIQQIFVALLMNAIEAVGNGGRIKVRTFYDFKNERVVFRISDSGPGMDAETMQHIFEPFFTTKEKANGSGLGLTVVYGIVERHGADISVDSAPGKGATFTIRMPLQPPPETKEQKMPAGTPPDRI